MITLNEIAKLSGVSVSTVSRILNNKGSFNEATKKKVLQVVESLMYKPNNVTEKMKSRSFSIGVYVPNTDSFINNNPLHSIDLNDLKKRIENTGNIFVLTTNTERRDRNFQSFKLIEEHKIDAAIVFDPYLDDQIVNQLMVEDIPYIITNGRPLNTEWNYIDFDNSGGASNVIDYLFQLGHRRIGLLAGPEHHIVNQNRLDGCRSSFKKHDLFFDPGDVLYGSFSFDHGYSSAKELIRKDRNVSCIFAFDDMIAYGAIKALSEMGLKVPDDISIIGFDDLELSNFMTPKLTTVRRDSQLSNQMIADFIDRLASNKAIDKIQMSLRTELVIRDSCAKPHASADTGAG